MILKQDGGYLVDVGNSRQFIKEGTTEEIISQTLELARHHLEDVLDFNIPE